MKRYLFVILILSVLLCGCQETAAQQTLFAMDTVMDLQVWGRDAENALEEMERKISTLDLLWSAADEGSMLSMVNRQNSAFPPDSEEGALLAKAEALSKRTGGAFDPKLRCVSALWNFTGENPHIPTDTEISAALSQKQWDLGGAMKGYTGQECVQILEGLHIDRAILNLGGNVQTYGQKPDGGAWKVGIQNPDGDDNLGVLSVTGTMAVVTSGDYQRYFERDGIRYHHILDPKTGYPADSGLRSVTVVCRDGMTADCLSTALFVMGLEESIRLWRESNDFEAVFFTSDGTIYATEGAVLSGCQYEIIGR